MNINSVYRNPALMDQALSMAGADATDASVISAAILDWVDRDDIPQAANGAERDYYLSLPQPIEAKNGVIDDLRELLQVRGVTPAIFWGPSWTISVMGGGDVAAALAVGGDDLAAGAGLSGTVLRRFHRPDQRQHRAGARAAPALGRKCLPRPGSGADA